MNTRMLHQIVDEFQTSFRAWFPSITDQDFITILTGPAESLLTVLQRRYGFTCTQAKGAWNQFVLCVVDGQEWGEARIPAWQPCVPVDAAMRLRFGRPASVTASAMRPQADSWIEARLV